MIRKLTLALVFSGFAFAVSADELTIEQKTIAAQMGETVLSRAIVSQLSGMCADVAVNEQALAAQRDHVMNLGKQQFSSSEAFMKAAGSDNKEKLGEILRRYFLDRGVEWDSSAKEYCQLANSLVTVNAPVSAFFKFK